MPIRTLVGERLYTLTSHPTLGEPRGFSWGMLTNKLGKELLCQLTVDINLKAAVDRSSLIALFYDLDIDTIFMIPYLQTVMQWPVGQQLDLTSGQLHRVSLKTSQRRVYLQSVSVTDSCAVGERRHSLPLHFLFAWTVKIITVHLFSVRSVYFSLHSQYFWEFSVARPRSHRSCRFSLLLANWLVVVY